MSDQSPLHLSGREPLALVSSVAKDSVSPGLETDWLPRKLNTCNNTFRGIKETLINKAWFVLRQNCIFFRVLLLPRYRYRYRYKKKKEILKEEKKNYKKKKKGGEIP